MGDLVRTGLQSLSPTKHTDNSPLSNAPLPCTPAQIQHSAGQHHSTAAVSSQMLTAGNNSSINMPNCLQVPMEGVTLIEQCAGVDCLFVGWYNDCGICTVTVRYTVCTKYKNSHGFKYKKIKNFRSNATPM